MKKILLLTFLLATPVLACDTRLAKYGVETTFDFCLYVTDATVGAVKLETAAHASGDTYIMKDEAAEANTTNGFTDEGSCYSIVLTATEMQAARIMLNIEDQSTKTWADKCIMIETYGNASAMHAFDLDTATQNVNVSTVTTGAIEAVDFAADGVTTSESTRTIGLASGQVDADDQFAGTHGLFMYNSNGPVGYSCIIDSANTGDTVTLVADLSAVHTVGDSYIIKPDAACARYLAIFQDSGEWGQYLADGSTKMCESTVADNGTTFTVGTCGVPD